MEDKLTLVSPATAGNSFLCIAARMPGVIVFAVGPNSCLRNLFFTFYTYGLDHKLYSLPVSHEDFASGVQVDLADNCIRDLALKNQLKAVLVYTSCSDLLVSTGYYAMGKKIEYELGLKVGILERGPLSLGKTNPKQRFAVIIGRWLSQCRRCEKIKRTALILAETVSGLDMELEGFIKKRGYKILFLNKGDDLEAMANCSIALALDEFGMWVGLELTDSLRVCTDGSELTQMLKEDMR